MTVDPYNWDRLFEAAKRHVESNPKIGSKNRKRILEYALYLESCDLTPAPPLIGLLHVLEA